MTQLDLLFELAEKENIIIEYIKLPKNILGLYFKETDFPPAIGINRNIVNDSKLFASVLAEELGHHFTTAGDLTAESFTYKDKLVVNKKENLALKWATELLIPKEKLVQALSLGNKTLYELSDYFNVTEEFISKRLYFLSTNAALNICYENII